MSERKYVVCRDREDGTRIYLHLDGTWGERRGAVITGGVGPLEQGWYHVPIRPKDALRRKPSPELEQWTVRCSVNAKAAIQAESERDSARAELTELRRAHDDDQKELRHKQAKWEEWMRACQESRAEVAVIRSERDTMQGRWETARAEVERLTEELEHLRGQWDKRSNLFAEHHAKRLVDVRRAAVEECRAACHEVYDRLNMQCGGAPEADGAHLCVAALLDMLTTPTADDGKGEVK